jgi:hypothetical protein
MSKVISREVADSVQFFLGIAEASGDDDLAVTLLRESAALIQRRRPTSSSLSPDQIRYLVDSGAFTGDELSEVQASVAGGNLTEAEQRTRLSAVTESLSAAEVATLLGIDQSRVRHRQAKGNLYAFTTGGKRRYPSWQFTYDTRQPVIPSLTTIIDAFPSDMHPASITGLMTTPQLELRSNGEATAPVDWLRQGGDPKHVVDIINSFLQA